jgi:hypothetical protein
MPPSYSTLHAPLTPAGLGVGLKSSKAGPAVAIKLCKLIIWRCFCGKAAAHAVATGAACPAGTTLNARTRAAAASCVIVPLQVLRVQRNAGPAV